MLAAVVLWVATAAFFCVRELDGAQGGYEIGRALGAGTGGLLLAAVARLIYVRLTPWGRGKPDTAPALFLLAVAITVVVNVIGPDTGPGDPVERYADAADECQDGDASPFAPTTAFEVRPLAADRRAEWEAQREGLVPDELLARVEIFEVMEGDRLVAVGSSVPGLTDRDRESFLSAAIHDAGIGRRGAVTPLTINGGSGYLARSPRAAAAVTHQGCWSMAVLGRDRTTVTRVSRSIASG
jgi:hypothetical protein